MARDDGARLETRGRVDMLRKGVGIDMAMAVRGFTATDIKKLWPTVAAPEARAWFIDHVDSGTIESANLKIAFPVGTLPDLSGTKPLPQNALSMDMVIGDIRVNAVEGLAPVEIQGKARLQVRDTDVTLVADNGVMQTPDGPLSVGNASLVVSSETPGESIVEVSGDLTGGIPAIVAIARRVQPDLLEPDSMPMDVDALTGDLTVATGIDDVP